MTQPVGRRVVFQGLGALGVAAALAGCVTVGEVAPTEAGTVLVPTGDVPVGGGVVLAERQLVVTQPTAGEFRAFQAVCTHQRSLLARVADDGIECDLHGSRFSIDDGSPTAGPATSPLAPVAVTVAGADVVAA